MKYMLLVDVACTKSDTGVKNPGFLSTLNTLELQCIALGLRILWSFVMIQSELLGI